MRDLMKLVFVAVVLAMISGCGVDHNGKDGLNGKDGTSIQGPTGAGTTGASGLAGVKGDTGSQGIQGVQGVQGVAGTNGSSCSVAQTETGATINCTDGTSANLINGTDGTNGTNGHDGAAGTKITFEQFCPNGFIPTYPSVFPEFGILSDGVVYGVYSANGGFLAELPPGQYSSNGINASCTFTINANGTVTQN